MRDVGGSSDNKNDGDAKLKIQALKALLDRIRTSDSTHNDADHQRDHNMSLPKPAARELGPHLRRLKDGETGCSLHKEGLCAGPINKVKDEVRCRQPKQEPKNGQVQGICNLTCNEPHKGVQNVS